MPDFTSSRLGHRQALHASKNTYTPREDSRGQEQHEYCYRAALLHQQSATPFLGVVAS